MKSKKQLENQKQNEMIILDWLFKEKQTPIKKQIKEYMTIKQQNRYQEKI